jgi:hypothetical protein
MCYIYLIYEPYLASKRHRIKKGRQPAIPDLNMFTSSAAHFGADDSYGLHFGSNDPDTREAGCTLPF